MTPGSPLRFQVVEEDKRSSPWRVWTARNADDMYIAGRSVAGHIKLSLHESGSWQHSYTSESAKRLQIADRHFDRWRRPPEFASGWTRAVQLVFPHEDLRPAAQADDVLCVPIHPQLGNATVITVLLHAVGAGPIRLDDAVLIGLLQQASGSSVSIIAQPVNLPEHVVGQLDEMRREVAASLDPALMIEDETPRIALFGRGASDDDRVIFELAVAPDTPG